MRSSDIFISLWVVLIHSEEGGESFRIGQDVWSLVECENSFEREASK